MVVDKILEKFFFKKTFGLKKFNFLIHKENWKTKMTKMEVKIIFR